LPFRSPVLTGKNHCVLRKSIFSRGVFINVIISGQRGTNALLPNSLHKAAPIFRSSPMAENQPPLSRRYFIKAGATGLAVPVIARSTSAQSAAKPTPADPRAGIPVELSINGQMHRLTIDPRTTLLDALREHVGLTGAKKGCDHGQCGACTVHADGKRVLSCLTLAASAQGREITTIEGIASPGGKLHPMQQAFIDHDGFQCGYCTPGQIMSAIACVKEGHAGSDAEIREYMSGNLCRCAAYPNIVAAIRQAKTGMES
jgi:xanthine dehydrogenase YagT iron-sulfur-binding subunit